LFLFLSPSSSLQTLRALSWTLRSYSSIHRLPLLLSDSFTAQTSFSLPSSSPSPARNPYWFQNETSPLSTYHRKLQGHTSIPNSNLTREPETLQANPPRPSTPIRLPCLPARSENIYAARLGLLNRRSIEELHRSSQVQAKCWTQDSTELVVKVAPGRV
jgi:hypothetical protein